MEIETQRNYEKRSWFDIVYEWEDEMCLELSADLRYCSKTANYINRIIRRSNLMRVAFKFKQRSLIIRFDISALTAIDLRNHKNTVPWIIDFYIPQSEFLKFFFAYKGYPLVLISSKEAYLKLKEANCPFNIEHLALSLPDMYRFHESVIQQKKYDVVLAGRTNKLLKSYLDKYIQNHPGLTILYRKVTGNNQFEYYDQNGTVIIQNDNAREYYMSILKLGKIALYTTIGKDNIDMANNYNQVTPRFLEILSAGCKPIMQYTVNPDTEYYELPSWGPSIECYEDFEREMDNALNTPVDIEKYTKYLAKHYTSVRVGQLVKILKENNLY